MYETRLLDVIVTSGGKTRNIYATTRMLSGTMQINTDIAYKFHTIIGKTISELRQAITEHPLSRVSNLNSSRFM